jgi:predicted RNA-binding protein
MALYLYTGVMGTGKSYCAVYDIWQQLQSSDDIFIVANIDGLKIDDSRFLNAEFDPDNFRHWDKNLHPQKGDSPFSKYIASIREEYSLSKECVVYLYVDECQRYFGTEVKDKDVVFFIEYHRHEGVELRFIVQDKKRLAGHIMRLHELETRATPARFGLPGFFCYKKRSNDIHVGTRFVPKKQKVFALYKSFGAGKKTTSHNIYLYFIVVVLAVVVFMVNRLLSKPLSGVESATQPQEQERRYSIEKNISTVQNSSSSTLATVSNNVARDVYPSTEEKDTVKEPPCMLPDLLEYSKSRDSVKFSKGGFPVWVKVSDFTKNYPPMFYGYSYAHAPGKLFVVYSALSQNMIFPKKFRLPEAQEGAPLEYDWVQDRSKKIDQLRQDLEKLRNEHSNGVFTSEEFYRRERLLLDEIQLYAS